MSELTRIADDARRKSQGMTKDVDPFTTEELVDIVEQTKMGFETVLQFMKEISTFVEFDATEFIEELQGNINELEKHY